MEGNQQIITKEVVSRYIGNRRLNSTIQKS